MRILQNSFLLIIFGLKLDLARYGLALRQYLSSDFFWLRLEYRNVYFCGNLRPQKPVNVVLDLCTSFKICILARCTTFSIVSLKRTTSLRIVRGNSSFPLFCNSFKISKLGILFSLT